MRMVFTCQECRLRYLPPEEMTYPASGEPASAVWCSVHQAEMRELGLAEPRVAAAVALVAARLALRVRADRAEDAPARPDVRPSRPARTGRARSGPGAARTRLR